MVAKLGFVGARKNRLLQKNFARSHPARSKIALDRLFLKVLTFCPLFSCLNDFGWFVRTFSFTFWSIMASSIPHRAFSQAREYTLMSAYKSERTHVHTNIHAHTHNRLWRNVNSEPYSNGRSFFQWFIHMVRGLHPWNIVEITICCSRLRLKLLKYEN